MGKMGRENSGFARGRQWRFLRASGQWWVVSGQRIARISLLLTAYCLPPTAYRLLFLRQLEIGDEELAAWSSVRLLVHISCLPSGEKTGSTSAAGMVGDRVSRSRHDLAVLASSYFISHRS